MAARLKINTMGDEVTLAMPIGALEDIAKHDPRLGELRHRLAINMVDDVPRWKWADIKAVLGVALTAGGSNKAADDIIEHEGADKCAAICGALLQLALAVSEPDRPKAAAVMEELLNSTPTA